MLSVSSVHVRVVKLAGMLVLLAWAPSARAGVIAADALPLPNRVARAEMIVIGKVTGLENQTVMVTQFPGATEKTPFNVAILTIHEALLAPKGVKTVRLGFVQIPPMVLIRPQPFQANLGMEGLFFLSKQNGADFQVAAGPLAVVPAENANFKVDVAQVKRCVKILADTSAALKGENKEDAFLAAAMIVDRCVTRRSPKFKMEPIDAAESKLILQALAGGDWTLVNDFSKLSPLSVLTRMPLTAADGWMPPKDRKELPAYAQQWLRDHAATYRIQRFVADK